VTNIVGHLRNGVSGDVLARALDYWRQVDDDLGARVAKELSSGG
jgi:catalase